MDLLETAKLILFPLLVAGFFGYAFWWTRFGGGRTERERQARFDRERGPRAHAQGWRYDNRAEGDIRYRIEGRTARGTPWTLAYDSDHASSSSRPALVFRTESPARGGHAWQITHRKAHELRRSAAGRAVTGTLVALLASLSRRLAQQREFMERAREVPAGSKPFRARFVLLATSADASRLIDSELERLILDWPQFKPSFSERDACFSAFLGPRGLEARLACDGPSFEVIEHLARLGQRLADRALDG